MKHLLNLLLASLLLVGCHSQKTGNEDQETSDEELPSQDTRSDLDKEDFVIYVLNIDNTVEYPFVSVEVAHGNKRVDSYISTLSHDVHEVRIPREVIEHPEATFIVGCSGMMPQGFTIGENVDKVYMHLRKPKSGESIPSQVMPLHTKDGVHFFIKPLK